MQRFALFAALVAFCSFPLLGSAQGPSVQLCVATMQVSGSNDTSPEGRDMLIKALSKEKNKGLAIESVPLPPSSPDDALAAAKQKGCDYIVTTNLAETHSVNSYSTGRANPVNTPTFYATTAYKLSKVSDGSEVSSGSFKASDSISEQSALGVTMKKIADKVTEVIRKAGPVSK
jgi:hypothetical protein